MKQVTKISFKGQSIYLGIDIHLKSWHVSIFSDDFELATKSFPPCAKTLGSYVNRMYPDANYYSAYEAGYCGYWVHENLIREGINNIIVNPADVAVKDKEKKRKTDSVDSRKLARELRKGELEGIYIPDKQQQEDKLLIRTRHAISKKQTSSKNQIKSTLGFFGIFITDEKINSYWSKAYLEWLRKLCEDNSSRAQRLKAFLEELESLRKIMAELTKQIRLLSQQERYKEDVRLLNSVCGISTLSAMTILTEFGNIKKYCKLDNLCSYVGLPGDEHTSGNNERKLGITNRGNKYLKKVLVEASWVAIKKDPALLQAYKNYNKKYPGSKSIIKIARKLLNRIRYVLVTGKEYQIQTV